MIESMYIGSGDVAALLMGKNTKTHQALLKRFVSGVIPYYNALASPIDQFRTGAILEERMLRQLPDDYFAQYKIVCQEMDVFKASLDFAKISEGQIVEFIEMKTIWWEEFGELKKKIDEGNPLEYILKKRKHEYNQVQEQLLCTGLSKGKIRYTSVSTYDDSENWLRVFAPSDYVDVEIDRDEKVIDLIKERGKIFQLIKDAYE